MNARWRLQLLGRPLLLQPGREALPLARKDAGWLACVALEPGAASLRVATLLWPEAGDRGALNNLRQRVHRLRKTTGARLVEMTETITLATDLQAAVPPAPEAESVDLWDLELLSGLEFDAESELAAWLVLRRKAWAEHRRDTLARMASDAEDAGDLVRALRYSERLLRDAPLSEHAHRRLMRLHYLRGDRAAALAAFEQCERLLKDELGVPPDAETLALLATVEASRPAAGVAVPVPVGLLRPPRTVGRDAVTAALAQAHGAGETPVLVGEAGMGKTRLLQDFVALLPQAVYVQARPSDGAVPYAALARLLRAVLDAVPQAADNAIGATLGWLLPQHDGVPGTPGAPRPGQLQSVTAALLQRAAQAGRHTLVLDDLHFADRASVEMFLRLRDAPEINGLRWVLAHRPLDAADGDAALLQSLADADGVRWIRLPPLDAAGIAELVGSLGLAERHTALLPALARHAGGNPLYLIETLRAMAAGPSPASGQLPRAASIEHLLDRRLQRLSKPALALARVAAIAVPDFDIEIAEAALGTPALALADAWHELESADLMRGEAFAHDLVRDAVLRATPATVARRAHGQVAALLARRGVEPARVAAHWMAAGRGAEAAAAYRDAAARALASGRAREQCDLLEWAARAHDLTGDADAALQRRNEAIGARLQCDGAPAALAQADALLAGALTGAQRALVLCSRAVVLLYGGRMAEAEAAASEALERASPDDDATALASARYLAHARAAQGDVVAAVAGLQRMQARADALHDAALQTEFYGDLGALLIRAEMPAAAMAAVQRHGELARQTGQANEQIGSLFNLFALRLRRGECTPALQLTLQAERLLTDPSQMQVYWAWNRTHMGIALARLGRFDEALARFDDALQVLREQGSSRLRALCEDRCAELLLLLGQTARAQSLLAGDEGLTPGHLAGRLLLRAQLATAVGQPADALLREAAARVAGEDQHNRIRVALELLPFETDPAQAIAQAQSLEHTAAGLGYEPLALQVAAQRLQLQRQQHDSHETAALAAQIEARVLALDGSALHLLPTLLRCAGAYRACGRPLDAERCEAAAGRWLYEAALPHTPPMHRDSLLERNADVRRLRALLARQAALSSQPSSSTTGA